MPLIASWPLDGPATTGTPATNGTVDSGWAWITGQLDAVPTWVWPALVVTLTLATLTLVPFLRAQAFKAGERTAGRSAATAKDVQDRRLLIAAMIPTVLFWIAVLTGSARGLTAFGRDDLNWTGGWEYLVPGTLDGVAISFGLLAFRAVRKERSPDRAVRIAASAMLASSAINFLHEVTGSTLGAGYLAILSILGMLIFDELLAQFEEGAAHIRREYPKFGLRWLTWPTNTVCAWFAWRNHPVGEDVDASIRAAIDHLREVRARKAGDRAANVDRPAWWMTFAPWVRSAQLLSALTEQRTETTAERQLRENLAADIDRIISEHTAQATEQESEMTSVRASVTALEAELEDLRSSLSAQADGHAQQLRRLAEIRAAEVAEARAEGRAEGLAEGATPHLDDYRQRPQKTATSRTSKTPPRGQLSDEAAVQMLLTAPADPRRGLPSGDLREWSQSGIVTHLGVGWGRAPRLLEAVTEAQQRRASEDGSGDQAVNQ